jgi:hypothetical protein
LDKLYLEVVEELVQELALFLGPMSLGLVPEKAQQVDGEPGLGQITPRRAGHRIRSFAKVDQRRASQHEK